MDGAADDNREWEQGTIDLSVGRKLRGPPSYRPINKGGRSFTYSSLGRVDVTRGNERGTRRVGRGDPGEKKRNRGHYLEVKGKK